MGALISFVSLEDRASSSSATLKGAILKFGQHRLATLMSISISCLEAVGYIKIALFR